MSRHSNTFNLKIVDCSKCKYSYNDTRLIVCDYYQRIAEFPEQCQTYAEQDEVAFNPRHPGFNFPFLED